MFDMKQFVDICNRLKGHGYEFSQDWINCDQPKKVLLRHDIDFCLDAALAMAKEEVNLDIGATYFFMESSETYNLFSRASMNIVRQIKQYGHKVSIHYDPENYEDDSSFVLEKDHFENLFDTEIDIVSIHRPRHFLENNNTTINGVMQTYHDRYTKSMCYISDSAGQSPDDKINAFLLNEKQRLHLLIHPVWWQGQMANPTDTLNDWLENKIVYLRSELKRNCRTYKG